MFPAEYSAISTICLWKSEENGAFFLSWFDESCYSYCLAFIQKGSYIQFL